MSQDGSGVPDFVTRFSPAYFAAVMATGVVSTASNAWGLYAFAWTLLGINVLLYASFLGLTIWRAFRARSALLADLSHDKTGVGSLTIIAGTSVLGTQIEVLTGWHDLPEGLWALAFLLYLVLLYWFFAVAISEDPKPPMQEALNGAWLLVIVCSQSLGVLGTARGGMLLHHPVQPFFCVCMFLVGLFFYFPIISMILYRWMFLPVPPESLTPPYWINMGAVAITTLAGSNLMLLSSEWPGIADLRIFIKGMTLLAWAVATWWLPLLCIVGFWRHVVQKVRLSYDPSYWSMVFPLGMYSLATSTLAKAINFPWINWLSQLFLTFALLAWLTVFVGFCRRVTAVVRGRAQVL
jgi:tellurite resistance protein TehA-like permease